MGRAVQTLVFLRLSVSPELAQGTALLFVAFPGAGPVALPPLHQYSRTIILGLGLASPWDTGGLASCPCAEGIPAAIVS